MVYRTEAERLHNAQLNQIAFEKHSLEFNRANFLGTIKDDLLNGRMSGIHSLQSRAVKTIELVKAKLETTIEGNTKAIRYERLAHNYIKEVGYSEAASITVSLASTAGLTNATLHTIVNDLGRAIVNELLYKRIATNSKNHLRSIKDSLAQMRKGSSIREVYTRLNKKSKDLEVDIEDIHERTLLSIATTLLDAIEKTNYITIQQTNTRDSNRVFLLDEYGDPIIDINSIIASFPINNYKGSTPLLLTPPAPIPESGKTGMFFSPELHNTYRAVRTSAHSRKKMRTVKLEQGKVVNALYKLSNVPFKINTKVLELINAIGIDESLYFNKPEKATDLVKPSLSFKIPKDSSYIDYYNSLEESDACLKRNEYAEYRTKCEIYEKKIKKHNGKLIALKSAITTAEMFTSNTSEFVTENLFYIPTFADSRGRIYYSSTINPQSFDAIKALLSFATPMPLGEDGLFWLKWNIATNLGQDKLERNLRVQWLDERLDDLRKATKDPLNNLEYWKTSGIDNPFLAYASAVELFEALELDDPTTYQSSVLVAVDATCSGGQLFSSMLRDTAGAIATNLTDVEGATTKQDLYTLVANATLANEDGQSIESLFWTNHGIVRDMAKTVSMTYLYNAKEYAIACDIVEQLIDDKVTIPEGTTHIKLGMHIAKALFKGVETVLPAAAKAKAWLTDMVRLAANDGTYLQFKSVTGLDVYNVYQKRKKTTPKLNTFGVKTITSTSIIDSVDVSKCVNSFLANFTHVLDAGLLTLVVLNADDQSMESVTTHDSFAFRACHGTKYSYCLRDTMATMFEENDPLKDLADSYPEYSSQLSTPTKGNFDINDIRSAEFTFC